MASRDHKKGKGGPVWEGPILVAIDFSEDSGAALSWASDIAISLKVPIHVLHVVHDPADSPGYYRKDQRDLLRPMEDVANKMMRKFLKKVIEATPNNKPLKDAKMRLVMGLPVTRIIEVAEKINARMIVMGSKGRSGLGHLLLGSKTEQVTQLSPIPVIVVKTKKDSQARGKKK